MSYCYFCTHTHEFSIDLTSVFVDILCAKIYSIKKPYFRILRFLPDPDQESSFSQNCIYLACCLTYPAHVKQFFCMFFREVTPIPSCGFLYIQIFLVQLHIDFSSSATVADWQLCFFTAHHTDDHRALLILNPLVAIKIISIPCSNFNGSILFTQLHCSLILSLSLSFLNIFFHCSTRTLMHLLNIVL